jgi:hypothetical protein
MGPLVGRIVGFFVLTGFEVGLEVTRFEEGLAVGLLSFKVGLEVANFRDEGDAEGLLGLIEGLNVEGLELGLIVGFFGLIVGLEENGLEVGLADGFLGLIVGRKESALGDTIKFDAARCRA